VAIPPGAVIDNANLSLYTRESFGNLNLTISAEDTDDANDFLTDPLGSRTRTSPPGQVSWDGSFVPLDNDWNQSPDIDAVIQAVIGRPLWQAGNDLAILIDDNGSTGSWSVSSYDESALEAAALVVDYTIPGDPAPYSFNARVESSADDTTAGAGETHPDWPAGWPLVSVGGGSVTVNWVWDEVIDPFGGTMYYHFQLASDAGYSDIIVDTGWRVDLLEVTTSGLENGRPYYARVRSHGECDTSAWKETSVTPDCGGVEPICGDVSEPRDPPDGWCEGGSVCIRWGWLPVEGATEYRIIVYDQYYWEVADSDWQWPGAFGRSGPYFTYTTCGLNSDETYRSMVGARGFCDRERWSDFTEFSYQCGAGLSTAWFQTQEGDVHSQESIDSNIPSAATDPYFSVDNAVGFPGVVSYNGFSADFGSGEVSTRDPGWLVEDSFINDYDFEYFYRRFDSPGDNFDGLSASLDELIALYPGEELVTIYPGDGQDLTLTGGDVTGGVKLIILVDGQVTITGDPPPLDVPFNVSSDSFLGIFVSGGIDIDGEVVDLQGVFFSDGTIDSCSVVPCNRQLIAQGVFVADDFTLARNLPDNIEPAEVFRYRPDLILNSPLGMWRSPQLWQELAP